MGFRYVVRQATPEDSGDILRLIKDHALYEHDTDQVVKVTEKALKDDGFGDHAFYHCLLGEAIDEMSKDDESQLTKKAQTSTVVAYAMYFYAYSSWMGKIIYLEDLYIDPTHRGTGLGKALISKVAKIGAENGCSRLQWVVFSSNENARKFYDHINTTDYTEAEGWRFMGAKGKQFVQLANTQPKPESNIDIL